MPMSALQAVFDGVVNDYFLRFADAVERRPCPDQHVGDVSVSGYEPEGYPPELTLTDPREHFAIRINLTEQSERFAQAPIILVLESPHKDEFRVGRDIGPAKGKTGKGIRSRIGDVLRLRNSGVEGRRPLVLMNAIRFQCSAGVPTGAHRTAIFRRMWEADGGRARQDFEERLGRYIGDHDDAIVVNACTAGHGGGRDIRLLVEDAVRTVRPRTGSDILLCHPENWVGSGRGSDQDGDQIGVITQWHYTPPRQARMNTP